MRGIGHILALTMMREKGDIRRLPTAGNVASSCRCVGSQQRSHGKRKGTGNTKNGHQSLAWACVEAAHCAGRDNPCITRFSQRTQAQTHTVVATKAVAHTWVRACWYLRCAQIPCDVSKALQSCRRTGLAGTVRPSMGLVHHHEPCLGRCPSLDPGPARSRVWAEMPLA